MKPIEQRQTYQEYIKSQSPFMIYKTRADYSERYLSNEKCHAKQRHSPLELPIFLLCSHKGVKFGLIFHGMRVCNISGAIRVPVLVSMNNKYDRMSDTVHNYRDDCICTRARIMRASACVWNPRYMMTSSNGNIFLITGHLCRDFTGPRWISRRKANDAGLWWFLWSSSE